MDKMHSDANQRQRTSPDGDSQCFQFNAAVAKLLAKINRHTTEIVTIFKRFSN